jgi:C1A family cysteine protease
MNVRRQVDLTEWASPVEEQWQLGSCTGQAIVGAYELLLKKYYPEKFVDLSRLFVYYNARELEGFVKEDVGAYIRSGVKAVSKYGICAEYLWPYDIEKFAVKPTAAAYADARTRVINGYYKIYNLDSMIKTLALDHPVVIGIQLYDGFGDVNKTNPILKMPRASEEPTGGHAMCVVGYDLDKKMLLCRNSFGTDWGNQGYCWIPFEYADKNFTDMWSFNISVK